MTTTPSTKSSITMRRSACLVALALAAAACGSTPPPRTGRGVAIRIASPRNGATVQGNVVVLNLAATGLDIVKADGDRTNKTGHYHVFLDREPVAAGQTIPKEPGIVHSAGFRIPFPGLSVGRHTFTAVLANGAHQRIGTTQARVEVQVAGPSISVTAPAKARIGQGIKLTVKVDGVNLVKPDGDSSGKSGHLHVFVDRDPTEAGKPIPREEGIIHTASSEISLQLLARGEHKVVVMLGDGNHVPFKAPVLDDVTFEIV